MQRKQRVYVRPSSGRITETRLEARAVPPKTKITGQKSNDHISTAKDNKTGVQPVWERELFPELFSQRTERL